MRSLATLFLLILLLAPATGSVGATAEEPDEQYLRAFNLIEHADGLNKSGQIGPARAKYLEAQTVLGNLKRANPNWNSRAVAFRLNYVAEKIAALSPKAPAAAPAAAPSVPSSEAKPAPRTASLPAGTQVKLIGAGAEPRKALRFHPVAGQKQAVTITLKMSMGESAGEMTKVPGIKLALGVEPKTVSAEGDINCETVVEEISILDEPGVAPQMVEVMKAAIGGIRGMKVVSTIADRGYVKSTELRIPAGTPAEMRDTMEQMKESFSEGEIFPEEPIGVGAKWEVRRKMREEGITIDEISTCQLASIEGEILTVNTISEQRAANQKVSDPSNPTVKADLVRLTGSITAKSTIDLTKVMPTQATAQERNEKTVSVTMAGQKQTVTQIAETASVLESK